MNQMKTCTRKDPQRAHKMVNLQKVITRHKKPWYIKIVGKDEAEGTHIKTSLRVYDKFDDRFLTCASLRRVSDPTLTLAVSLLTWFTLYLRWFSVLSRLRQFLQFSHYKTVIKQSLSGNGIIKKNNRKSFIFDNWPFL